MRQYSGVTDTAQAFMQTKLREILNDNGLTVTGSFKITLSNGKEYFYNAKAGQMANSEVDLYPTTTASANNSAVTENSKYISNGKTAVIPAGYAISNVATEQSIDTGLVITKGGNEWVWIPVSSSDLTAMYTEDTTGWTMSGTEVVTKYKSNSEIISGITRGNPGTTDWREPDVLNDDSYDKNTTNLSAAGLGANLSEMATKLRDDYKNMIASLKKNGGFYVGRYELSEAGTKKDQPSLVSTTWYNLYAKCKTFGDESTTYSRMIWGCQWDQVCKFISTSGDQVSLTDSRTYGNYSSYTKRNTGSNDTWKTNNIYDLAGNCYEWTQEARNTYCRVFRGGNCYNNGSYAPVTYRGDSSPTNTDRSSRPTLYIK